jgi:two-component system OmpR family response regulator
MPGKKKILVVDDEPQVCDSIAMLLTFAGYEVVTAGSGQEALAKFAQDKFDLVTTDYLMSEMNGADLALAVKALAPAQPVIMITAHGDMLKTSGVSLAGVDQMVSKPFQLADLREAIQKVLIR